MLVRTAPETQNKPIHATENLVPYAPQLPHPTTTTTNNNQPTADTNQTGHPSKQHGNRNTTRPDQQPKAMRIQSRRHPPRITQPRKSSRNDIQRESRSRGNRVASASFGGAQAHAIPLPGPAGRVPQASPHRSPALRAVFRRRVRTAPRPCGPCSAGESVLLPGPAGRVPQENPDRSLEVLGAPPAAAARVTPSPSPGLFSRAED